MHVVQRVASLRSEHKPLSAKPDTPAQVRPCVKWLSAAADWLRFAVDFPIAMVVSLLPIQRELGDLNTRIRGYRAFASPWSTEQRQTFDQLLGTRDAVREQWKASASALCSRLDTGLTLPALQVTGRPPPPSRLALKTATYRVQHLLTQAEGWTFAGLGAPQSETMPPSQGSNASPAFEDVKARFDHAIDSLAKWHDLRAQAALETNARAQGFFGQLQAFAHQACGVGGEAQVVDAPEQEAALFVQAVQAEEALVGQAHEKLFPHEAVWMAFQDLHSVLQRLHQQLIEASSLRHSLKGMLQANDTALTLLDQLPQMHKDFAAGKRKLERDILLLQAGNSETDTPSDTDTEETERKVEECQQQLRREKSAFHRAWASKMDCVLDHRPELLLRGWCASQDWAEKKQKPGRAASNKPAPLQPWVMDMLSHLDSEGLEKLYLTLDHFEELSLISTSSCRHEVQKGRTVDGKQVALKRFASTSKHLPKLRKEIRLLQRMKHPYIAEVDFTFMAREAYYMVMPFYSGGTLTEWLTQPHSWEEKRVVMRQVLLGVQHVHYCNVVHCDLKPDNFLLESTDPLHVRVCDFDVSLDNEERATKSVTLSMTQSGLTPHYAAPEVQPPSLQRATAASDVYSLGLVCTSVFFSDVVWEVGQPVRLPRPDEHTHRAEQVQLLPLLQAWLQKDPMKRPTVMDILAHPFFSTSSLAQEKQLEEKDRKLSETRKEILDKDQILAALSLAQDQKLKEKDRELSMKQKEILEKDQVLGAVNRELSELEEEKRLLLGPPRSCCLCFDEFFLSQGVECCGAAERHFMCRECFSRHVTDQATQDLDRRKQRKGEILCPYRGPELPYLACTADPFPCELIALRAEPEALRAYLDNLKELKEQELAATMEVEKQQAIRDELQRLARMSEFERKVVAARTHAEHLLNLKCPRCQRVFLDFNGCFALTCNGCACGFCAWCLADCGQDAHRHVTECKQNLAPDRGYFSTLELFEQAHKARRERELRAYFDSLGSQELREAVIAKLFQSLLDLGLQHLAH